MKSIGQCAIFRQVTRRILITGGAGFIGSSLAKALDGHELLLIDDLSRGFLDALPEGCDFKNISLLDASALKQVITEFKPDTIVHAAGYLVVHESVSNPILYRKNNWLGFRNLMKQLPSPCRFLFSSSCTVYGQSTVPIVEDQLFAPLSPYGYYKAKIEDDLKAHSQSDPNFKYVSLRYFNVAGARPDKKIGQRGLKSTQLIKSACLVATGKQDVLPVYAFNQPLLIDDTCVRDFVHIEDLIEAHRLALEFLWSQNRSDVFNLGNGRGYSVRQVIETIETITGQKLNTLERPARPGDAAIAIASNEKIRRVLKWKPNKSDLFEICNSSLEWERLN